MHYRLFFISLLVIVLTGCNSSTNKDVVVENEETPNKELIMVEPSEMANLMNEMYAFNEAIKQQILNGELNTSYSTRFDNIHSAVLTDPSDRDLNFESFSKLFIESQKALFEAPKEELVMRYNNAINACISCHNVKCSGPIPRIKKLLIK